MSYATRLEDQIDNLEFENEKLRRENRDLKTNPPLIWETINNELIRIGEWIQAEYDQLELLLNRRKDRLAKGFKENEVTSTRVMKHAQELALLFREQDTLKAMQGNKWAISSQEGRSPENQYHTLKYRIPEMNK